MLLQRTRANRRERWPTDRTQEVGGSSPPSSIPRSKNQATDTLVGQAWSSGGDQRTVVSCRKPVPSRRTIQTSASFSPSVKAIHSPSGDHSGEQAIGVPSGSTGGCPPSARTRPAPTPEDTRRTSPS